MWQSVVLAAIVVLVVGGTGFIVGKVASNSVERKLEEDRNRL